MNEKWEYKCVPCSASINFAETITEIGEMLNSLGNEGWELVVVTCPGNVAYLKRRIN